jgi:hypothetical protein
MEVYCYPFMAIMREVVAFAVRGALQILPGLNLQNAAISSIRLGAHFLSLHS